MDAKQEKKYIIYAQGEPGTKSKIFRKAQLKNEELMRYRTIDEHRRIQHRLFELRPVPPDISVREGSVNGIPCEWITGKNHDPDRVILYLHGGSWIYGDLRTARHAGMLLAEFTGYTVLVIDYRLAPEHPWPAGLEDCVMAYHSLLLSGFAPGSVGLFGDSAGGNLSLCLLQKLRRDSLPLPGAVACASPVTDLTRDSHLYRSACNLMFTQYMGRERGIFSMYLQGAAATDPLVSPLFGELSRLPPVLIHVGGEEPLCGDCIRFTEAAVEQGGDVMCGIWPGMFHDFTIVGPALKESKESLEQIACFYRQQMNPNPQ